jgi:N-acetyl-gamma-glutamyl-phosphate reductase
MTRISLAGASGYAGGELLRLLASHPEFSIGPLAAGGKAGMSVGEVHPQLPSLGSRVLAETTPQVLADADLVFLALPHGESAELVSQLPAEVRVVDLGADFRLASEAAWTTYYGGKHAGAWVYGLPELPGQRALIADSTRIANPGCYATSVELAFAPLLAAGLIDPLTLVVVAASGTSGAGRKPTENLLATAVMGSMSAYKVGGVHQHTPEIEQQLGLIAGAQVRLSFTPLLAPMPRGIIATCTAQATEGVSETTLRDALHSAYDAEPFVHLLAPGTWPQTGSVSGSNMAQMQIAFDAHSGRVVIVSVIDNLGKGAAGQALQNANIISGFPETAGLSTNGVAP